MIYLKNTNMNKMKNILLFVLIVLLLQCHGGSQGDLMPTVSGNASEITVVMSKHRWESLPGAEMKRIFNQVQIGLPQEEPIFDLFHITPEIFENKYKTRRNIIITRVLPKSDSKITVQKNIWARTQVVVNVTAGSDTALVNLLQKNEDNLIALILNSERERIMGTYESNLNRKVVYKLKENHHIYLAVPNGYSIYTDSSDFVWIGIQRRENEQGIFVYTYNYTAKNTFTLDYLLNKRNSILKKYVPGEAEGSYMATERRYPTSFSEFSFKDGRYFVELRGLWTMKNGYAMGGPFVSLTTYDEARNRIITVEGFVFAPDKNKRDYVRQVEAIIYSLKILEDS